MAARTGKGMRPMTPDEHNRDRRRRYWDTHSASYDKQMGFFDRHLFGDSRAWVCSRAAGRTLEVGIGTGLNLPFYGDQVELTGIDFSPAMLTIARQRAARLGREAELREADAMALPFPGASFDAVICTFTLCAVPDDRGAVTEMARVLRPGRLLLFADHVAASAWPARAVPKALDLVTVPLQGERRPTGIALGAGGLAGANTGARLQSRLPDVLIRRVLGVLVIAIGARYLASWLS
jgi:ubiquinone/menaquinone biosynthesis C-methylase UbiE